MFIVSRVATVMGLPLTWIRVIPPDKQLDLEDIWLLGSSPLSSESPSILCKLAVSYCSWYLTGFHSDRNVSGESV